VIESIQHERLRTLGKLLLERLDNEIVKPESMKDIERRSIEVVSRKIKERLKQVTENNLPRRDVRYKEITRIIVDEWPLGSELGIAISEWENLYCEL
jgi:hypothetical protein